VTLLGAVTDEHLRWLYANCTGVVAASYEDYGLTPLEALRFGRPSAVLRYGGFLDTVREGETGVFFDRPESAAIAAAVEAVARTTWRADVLEKAFQPFREETFIRRLQEIADRPGRGSERVMD
jgi:glycosyltransferase involved in cell wall biosynthesis